VRAKIASFAATNNNNKKLNGLRAKHGVCGRSETTFNASDEVSQGDLLTMKIEGLADFPKPFDYT